MKTAQMSREYNMPSIMRIDVWPTSDFAVGQIPDSLVRLNCGDFVLWGWDLRSLGWWKHLICRFAGCGEDRLRHAEPFFDLGAGYPVVFWCHGPKVMFFGPWRAWLVLLAMRKGRVVPGRGDSWKTTWSRCPARLATGDQHHHTQDIFMLFVILGIFKLYSNYMWLCIYFKIVISFIILKALTEVSRSAPLSHSLQNMDFRDQCILWWGSVCRSMRMGIYLRRWGPGRDL